MAGSSKKIPYSLPFFKLETVSGAKTVPMPAFDVLISGVVP